MTAKHTHVPLERAVSPAVARNAALGAVTTPWVANVDDDDFLAPGFATAVTRYVGPPIGGSVYFAVSQDYYPDGTTVQWDGQVILPALTDGGFFSISAKARLLCS